MIWTCERKGRMSSWAPARSSYCGRRMATDGRSWCRMRVPYPRCCCHDDDLDRMEALPALDRGGVRILPRHPYDRGCRDRHTPAPLPVLARRALGNGYADFGLSKTKVCAHIPGRRRHGRIAVDGQKTVTSLCAPDKLQQGDARRPPRMGAGIEGGRLGDGPRLPRPPNWRNP